MNHHTPRITALLTITMLAPPAIGQCELEQQLVGSSAQSGSYFGYSVAASGEFLLVGASSESVQGAAYIFERAPVWLETARLVPSQSIGNGQGFGRAVALDGDIAVIGAPVYNNSIGAAYVYERNGSFWQQTATLSSPVGASGANFGATVAVEGEQVFVGRRIGSQPTVYVYERNGASWAFADELTAVEDPSQFGRALMVEGEMMLVGAVRSAYIFERVGGQWQEVQELLSSDGQPDDGFGWSVSLLGNTAIVGDPFHDSVDIDSGAAYVFRRDSQTSVWSEEDKLTADDPEASHMFGQAVSLGVDRAFVGAYYDGDIGYRAGSVYVFEPTGSDWGQVDERYATMPAALHGYGYSLAMGEFESLVVGAVIGDYAIVDSPWIGISYCQANPNSTGLAAEISVLGDCEASENDLLLGAVQLPPNKFGYFLLSQNQGFFANPGGSQGNLCIAGPIGRFQSQVQNSGPEGLVRTQDPDGIEYRWKSRSNLS